MAESFHCLPDTITTLLISYTPIQNKNFKKKCLCDFYFHGNLIIPTKNTTANTFGIIWTTPCEDMVIEHSVIWCHTVLL